MQDQRNSDKNNNKPHCCCFRSQRSDSHAVNTPTFPAVRLGFFPCLCFTGVFSTSASSSCPGVALSLELGDPVARLPADASADTRSHTTPSGRHRDSDDSPRPEEVRARCTSTAGESAETSRVTTNLRLPLCFPPAAVQQRPKHTRLCRDRMQLDCLEQLEGPIGQEDPSRVKIRHRVRQMLSDVPAEENKTLLFKGKSKGFSL